MADLRREEIEIRPSRIGRAMEFSQWVYGWPRSGFKRRKTTIDVRRVRRSYGNENDVDEAQIHINILDVKGDKERVFEHFGSLTIPGDQVQKLIDALTIHAEQTKT